MLMGIKLTMHKKISNIDTIYILSALVTAQYTTGLFMH